MLPLVKSHFRYHRFCHPDDVGTVGVDASSTGTSFGFTCDGRTGLGRSENLGKERNSSLLVGWLVVVVVVGPVPAFPETREQSNGKSCCPKCRWRWFLGCSKRSFSPYQFQKFLHHMSFPVTMEFTGCPMDKISICLVSYEYRLLVLPRRIHVVGKMWVGALPIGNLAIGCWAWLAGDD